MGFTKTKSPAASRVYYTVVMVRVKGLGFTNGQLFNLTEKKGTNLRTRARVSILGE